MNLPFVNDGYYEVLLDRKWKEKSKKIFNFSFANYWFIFWENGNHVFAHLLKAKSNFLLFRLF